MNAAAQNRCHPERLEKIGDFQKESKDLRTDLTANVPSVRGSFDSLRSLRMTDFGRTAKNVILQRARFVCLSKGMGTDVGVEDVGKILAAVEQEPFVLLGPREVRLEDMGAVEEQEHVGAGLMTANGIGGLKRSHGVIEDGHGLVRIAPCLAEDPTLDVFAVLDLGHIVDDDGVLVDEIA